MKGLENLQNDEVLEMFRDYLTKYQLGPVVTIRNGVKISDEEANKKMIENNEKRIEGAIVAVRELAEYLEPESSLATSTIAEIKAFKKPRPGKRLPLRESIFGVEMFCNFRAEILKPKKRVGGR